jgi:hypothetical protein
MPEALLRPPWESGQGLDRQERHGVLRRGTPIFESSTLDMGKIHREYLDPETGDGSVPAHGLVAGDSEDDDEEERKRRAKTKTAPLSLQMGLSGWSRGIVRFRSAEREEIPPGSGRRRPGKTLPGCWTVGNR